MAIASLIASENISAGNAVYVTSAGLAAKADALTEAKASVAGIAVDTVSTGGIVRINVDGVYSGYSGLTPGEFRFLSITTAGSLVSYDEFVAEFATVTSDAYLTNVGRVITSTTISIEIIPPQLVLNPTAILLLETSTEFSVQGLLLEDGSNIDLETASA